MSSRVCDTCQRELPLTTFRRCGSGRSYRCPACTNQTYMASPGHFFCRTCRVVKPLQAMLKDNRKPLGVRHCCKACYRERYTSYRARYRRDPGYQRRRTAYARAFRMQHALPPEVRDPTPATFRTEDFEEAGRDLEGADAGALAAALRSASLRGIWEGYQRAMRSIEAYGPPPDVRELRRALWAAGVEREHLPSLEREEKREKVRTVVLQPLREGDLPLRIEDLKRLALERALQMTNWNVSRAAKLLGVSRQGVYVLMSRYGKPTEPPDEGEASDPLEAEVDQVLSQAI